MSRLPERRIEDIVDAIERCQQYADFLSTPADREPLSLMAEDAIERQLQIIGEAVNHLPVHVTDAHPEVPWAQIRGFRTILVHQYFGVDREIVLDVVRTHLPVLAAAVSGQDMLLPSHVAKPDTPLLLHTVIDAADCRGLAEFYRQLLDLRYRSGDDVPQDGPDDVDWIVLVDASGRRVLAIQEKAETAPPTWPSEEIPLQMHMDFLVRDARELEKHRARAEALGARLLRDRSDDPDEPLYVMADPAGHPFCLLASV